IQRRNHERTDRDGGQPASNVGPVGSAVGGAINIVRVESAEGGVNAAGIGRVNGETGASAIRQVGRAQVLARPGGVGGSTVGSGINVAVVVTHPDDVGVARGNRDGADERGVGTGFD